jgi:hypothetical protein
MNKVYRGGSILISFGSEPMRKKSKIAIVKFHPLPIKNKIL